MAKFDHGGCSCGLYRECLPDCEHNDLNKLSSPSSHSALMLLIGMKKQERVDVLKRLEELLCINS